NHALAAKARGHRRRCHTMLTRARFGDDPLLAHALREQNLADGVVDLVRARVKKVFALQVNSGAAEMLGKSLGEIERRRSSDVIREQVAKFVVKGRILPRGEIFALEFL